MTLSKFEASMEKGEVEAVEQVAAESKGKFEDSSLISAAEERALVRKIDRK
jgi:hypothetical protein